MKIIVAHLVISAYLYLSAINFLTTKTRSFLKDREVSFSRMARANLGLLPLFSIPIFNVLVYLAILDKGEKEIAKQVSKYIDK